MEFILVMIHDRHTDDRFLLYPDTPQGLVKAKEKCMSVFPNCSLTNNYGDWCCYINDDYYASLQLVNVEEAQQVIQPDNGNTVAG